MKDVTEMTRTHRRKLATIGAAALTAAAIAVAAGTAETALAAPAAFAKSAVTAVPAAKTITTTATATVAYTAPTRALAPGMIDGQFGPDTQAALWAFQEINGIKVTGVDDAATARALAHPRTYKSPAY